MLLIVIAIAAFASTLLGGLLALRLRDKLHLILGFSAGAVIGVAFFDLLPEAVNLGQRFHSPAVILSWTALGFLLYLVLDRIMLFHGEAAPRGPFAAGVLCIHSLLDGVAVGVAFQTSREVGIVVAIGVLSHDFSDGINTMNVVLKNRGDRRQAFRWLLADALAPVAGVASTYFFTLPGDGLGTALALFAGFFLYIGASDLIPESYHAHPKFLTTAMTLAGAAVLYLAVALIGQ
ncbi:MAG: ZIP family metal transporter [Pseudomonadota bacterium]|nr:ZIP family metal transporter [Pseudomonadota bacterium]